MIKKILLFVTFICGYSFAQQHRSATPQATPPPPPSCWHIHQIDSNNDGFATFNVDLCIAFIRANALQLDYNLAGYTIQLYSFSGTPLPAGTTFANTTANEDFCSAAFTYTGSGPFYDQPTLLYLFGCYKIITTPYNGDFDQDGVLNYQEDLNNNLFLMDDNTDGDSVANFWDIDDDNDEVPTLNEDYNNNGTATDDDTNTNGIIDYLDASVTSNPNLNLNLKLFIEGYYTGASLMRSVKFNQDGISPLTDVENITVELRSTISPFSVVTSTTAILKNNGIASCNFPSAPAGLYYIVLHTRNSVETWSATPQLISSTSITYDFSNSAAQAFGDNLKDLGEGVFGLYSGDYNQDGNIDTIDYPLWESDSNSFASGDYTTDLNGDGNVDTIDYPVWEDNSNNFVSTVKP